MKKQGSKPTKERDKYVLESHALYSMSSAEIDTYITDNVNGTKAIQDHLALLTKFVISRA